MLIYLLKALRGEHNHLADVVKVDISDTFKPCLHDLLKVLRALAHSVYVLVIVDLLNALRLVNKVLDDGERYVGLKR